MTAFRCTSSPNPSTTRPQRGSRETSIIGENVQVTPPERASRAAVRASCSTMAGSKDAACPSGTGAIVRCPWITSSPIRIGMPSRVFSTASRCSAFEATADCGQNIDPIPSRTRAAASSRFGRKMICSWPSFSAGVICARIERMRALCMTGPLGGKAAAQRPGLWAAAGVRPGATGPRPHPSLPAPGRPSSDRSAGPGRPHRGCRRRPGWARWRWEARRTRPSPADRRWARRRR